MSILPISPYSLLCLIQHVLHPLVRDLTTEYRRERPRDISTSHTLATQELDLRSNGTVTHDLLRLLLSQLQRKLLIQPYHLLSQLIYLIKRVDLSKVKCHRSARFWNKNESPPLGG